MVPRFLGLMGLLGVVGAKRETILNNDWKYIPSLFPFLPQHPQHFEIKEDPFEIGESDGI